MKQMELVADGFRNGRGVDILRKPSIARFPATRYQGSKTKLLPWIWQGLQHLPFDTCLDLFSGTGCVSYLFKVHGKSVTSNDRLAFNQVISRALVVNSAVSLSETKATRLHESTLSHYDDFISRTFSGVYFLDAENSWLDRVIQNIETLPLREERDLALFALYQACLAKRPYNLFHRANLYMRTAEVPRTFGNKSTWDKSFDDHFLGALREANNAVFDNGRPHRALAEDFLNVPGDYDLVYMDPPYLNAKGTGVDYLGFYHFLEGITEYRAWPNNLTEDYKHKPYRRQANPWTKKETILRAFDDAIDRYRDSIVAVSYRSDGIPSVEALVTALRRHGRKDARRATRDYQYVLSSTQGKEVLLVSEP